MRIYTTVGAKAFKTLTFPDGQRHLEFTGALSGAEPFTTNVTIETSIGCADVIFDVLLAADALQALGHRVSLDIRYLLGARMDRRIAPGHPESLRVVCRQLATAGFDKIRILDPHSDVALGLLNAEAVYPTAHAYHVLGTLDDDEPVIIIPDKGAKNRIERLFGPDMGGLRRVQCLKERDVATGRLSNFVVTRPLDVDGHTCVIFDDLCDGGGTFVGLAHELRAAGATGVVLFVTHAIMSKGLVLAGIDHVYATDSYANHGNTGTFHTLPISMENPQCSTT